MFAPQTWSDNFVVIKCSLCSHEVKRALIFMRFDRTSLAKRLHFSCTEGALNWKSTCKCKCFFGSPCWTRTNDPAVNSGCDANIKQCHSIPYSVEPWFYLYNAINKRFAWCEKSLNNNSVRQLLDGLLAVVLIILQSGVKETRWVAVLRNTGSIPVSANLNLKFYSGHRRRQAFLSCCTVQFF